jgi:dienelactone hydrolase
VKTFLHAAVLLAALWLPPATAKLVEEVVRTPVTVTNIYGRPVTREIVVTLWRDDAMPAPHPVAVIGHGRSGNAQGRDAVKRSRYPTHAQWLASLGFLVAIPTRIGYGETGGEDVEYSGACSNRNYPPTFLAASAQLIAALNVARARPEASRTRGIVLGQSFGGAAAIGVASRNPPGVQAIVSFAGGGGGDPIGSPQEPCAPNRIERMFSGWGTFARIPTLWIYTENDMYFGARYPREWFDAFRDAGGVGEFVLFPPYGADGHLLFNEAPELWRPRVLEFLRANGFPELKEKR